MKTFGSLKYAPPGKGKLWILEAEPHVVLRAKRVFEGSSRQQYGVGILVTDSARNARELYWFLQRFPLLMSDEDFERLEQGAAEHEEKESLVDRVLAGKHKHRRFKLAIPARDYQQLAADMWLRVRGLLIADEVGLGKSATSICALTDPCTRPALVVTLPAIQKQWQREIARFAPELSTHIIRRVEPYDIDKKAGALPDVIITSYSKLAGWAETLAPLVKSVVWDEIQELRSGIGTPQHPVAKGLAARVIAGSAAYRCGLSATPIFNFGDEMFNVMEVIAPGELGSRDEFVTEFCSGKSLKDASAFGLHLREAGLMLRRTRADVGRELADLSKVVHYVDVDHKPLKDAEREAERLARIILDRHERAAGEVFRASEELSALMRHATGLAKAPVCAEFVRMLIENGEPVVVAAWHRSVYDVLNERLAEYKPAMYTGSESPAQKDEARRRFTGLRPDGSQGERETQVLLMSLRSGVGLDGLQFACRTVVFAELDWSPGVHEQLIGRVHRDGQKDPVVAYYLLSEEGSDPIVADVLGLKREQVEGIRNPGSDHLEKLESNPERIKALARRFLASRGKSA